MHLKKLLQGFNASNFAVYSSLLVFSILLSLRVSRTITWSYAAVFIPIWVWNALVLCGAVVGVVFWTRKKTLRQDPDHVHHFKAMLLSATLQLPVFIAELLVVINIETGAHSWRAVFTPLYLLCALSIPACVWECWRGRGVELELLSMLNLLQFIFLGLRLDGVVEWSWAIVFIPSWILLGVFPITVAVYSCILVALHQMMEQPELLQQQKVTKVVLIVAGFVIAVCLIVFLALLVSQLDGRISAPLPAIFVPLHLAILGLLATTISRRPGNPWWFGIRKNFADLILDCCPLLQEYVNVSYVREDREVVAAVKLEKDRSRHEPPKRQVQETKPSLYPREDIYTPD